MNNQCNFVEIETHESLCADKTVRSNLEFSNLKGPMSAYLRNFFKRLESLIANNATQLLNSLCTEFWTFLKQINNGFQKTYFYTLRPLIWCIIYGPRTKKS